MRKIIVFLLTLLVLPAFANGRNDKDVVLHQSGCGNGHELVYLDPPQVTYDEELNELTVYFGSSGTIDLECDDGFGSPYYFVYGEYHYGNTRYKDHARMDDSELVRHINQFANTWYKYGVNNWTNGGCH